jgi:hypothetical protein
MPSNKGLFGNLDLGLGYPPKCQFGCNFGLAKSRRRFGAFGNRDVSLGRADTGVTQRLSSNDLQPTPTQLLSLAWIA